VKRRRGQAARYAVGSAASFYRTSAGAEIDLVLELPGRHGIWAIEVKRAAAAGLEWGFHNARGDVKPKRSFIVYAGQERFPLGEGVEAIGLAELAAVLEAI
jgi:hypothetical protein